MMLCQNCKTENPDDYQFCGGCGQALGIKKMVVPVPGDDGAFYCAKHPKAVTRLRCGRCEAPMCAKCTVYTPAGTRCRSCAKNKVALRPKGVLHEVGYTVSQTGRFSARGWYLLIPLSVFLFSHLFHRRQPPPPSFDPAAYYDSTIKTMLQAAPDQMEALSWLQKKDGKERTIGLSLHTDGSLHLVKDLYRRGAVKVIALDIDHQQKAENAGGLIVVLPNDAAARKRLFTLDLKIASEAGDEPMSDVGQRYLALSW